MEHVPAFAIEPVEPTGAGDAFTAAIVSRYLEEKRPPDQSDVVFASAAGAITATRVGAIESLPTTAEIEQFLATGNLATAGLVQVETELLQDMAMTRPDPSAGEMTATGAARRKRVRKAADLSVLQDVREVLNASDNPAEITRNAVDALVKHVGYTHVGAYLIRLDGLHLLHQVGYDNPASWLDINLGICGRVARTGQGELVVDVYADPDYISVDSDVRSEIAVPFGQGSASAGVLNVEMTGPLTLTEDDFRIVTEIAGMLSLAIDTRRLDAGASPQRATTSTGSGRGRNGGLDVDPFHRSAGLAIRGRRSGHRGRSNSTVRTVDELLAHAHAGDFAHLEHAFSRAVVDGEMDVEFRLADGGASVRWLNLRGQAIDRAADGSPTRITGVVFDVTGRKRLEGERLRLVHLETARTNAEDAQREMATTIERLRDGFVAIDSERRLSLVNEEAARLFGASRSELLGLPLEDALGYFRDEYAIANFLTACTVAEPSAFDAYDPRADRFLEVRVYPGQGGATLHLRDVTALRRAEYERQRSEAMFRSLVQHASDLILILDRRAVIQFASPAVDLMLGYQPEEVIGRDDYVRQSTRTTRSGFGRH